MADNLEVKTNFSLNRVKVPICCWIQTVVSKKDKELVFLSSGDRFLYLFESSRILNIFLFSGCVRYFVTDGQFVLVSTEDGKIWCVPFSRHKVKTSSKPINQDSRSTLPTNQAIFSDLLSNNSKQHPNTDTKSSAPVTEVLPNHAILHEPGVHVILPYKGFLITVATNVHDIVVSFYEKCNELSYNPIPFHRVFLKNAGATISSPASLQLLCRSEFSGHHVLQRSLFDVIKPKGSQENTVLLLGTSDGRLLSINTSPDKMQYKPKLVWDLEEPVSYLSVAALTNDSRSHKNSNNHNNSIIIVGRSGKCVIVYDHEGKCSQSSHNLSGPIICCSKHDSSIFYSNVKEVCMAKLSFVKSGDSSNVVLVTTYFNIANIAVMSPLKLSCTPDKTKLAILTLDGKVLKAYLPCGDTASCFKSTPGSQLKDLLSNIEHIVLQTKSMQKDLDNVDKVLQQLNQDITLVFKVKSCLKPSQFLKWTVCPGYAPSTDSYYLIIKLHNLSRTLLVDNWAFLVQVGGLPSKKHFSPIGTISHSWNIGNLSHGLMKDFYIPLPTDYSLTQCLSIEAILCYNLKSLIEKLPLDTLQATDSVLLPLGLTHIDILHFMASHCRVSDGGFLMFIRPSQLDDLESVCELTQSLDRLSVAKRTESTLQTLRLPMAREVFTSIPKPCKPVLMPINQELQLLYSMMSYTDEVVEVNREASGDSEIQNDVDKHAVRIWLEPSPNTVVIVLHGPSTLELYALLEAFASRLRIFISHCCSTDKLDDVQLKETLQRIEKARSQLNPQIPP